MTPSLEGLPTKAKEAPSLHEVRLATLNTNRVFHCFGEKERKLLFLAPRLGGLVIPIFEELREIENQNSSMTSEHLCNRITYEFKRHEPDLELNNKKKQIKSMKNDRQKKIPEVINEMISEERKQNDLRLETCTSSWLTTLPIKEEGYILNKQSFWNLISTGYGWRLK